jgi:hypothetical protein
MIFLRPVASLALRIRVNSGRWLPNNALVRYHSALVEVGRLYEGAHQSDRGLCMSWSGR